MKRLDLEVQGCRGRELIDLPETPQEKTQYTHAKGQKKWKKDPSIAKACIMNSGYICEINRDHSTFTSKVTGKNYVEAHHLISMSIQDMYLFSLYIKANIVSLCPNCHRLLRSECGKT